MGGDGTGVSPEGCVGAGVGFGVGGAGTGGPPFGGVGFGVGGRVGDGVGGRVGDGVGGRVGDGVGFGVGLGVGDEPNVSLESIRIVLRSPELVLNPSSIHTVSHALLDGLSACTRTLDAPQPE